MISGPREDYLVDFLVCFHHQRRLDGKLNNYGTRVDDSLRNIHSSRHYFNKTNSKVDLEGSSPRVGVEVEGTVGID